MNIKTQIKDKKLHTHYNSIEDNQPGEITITFDIANEDDDSNPIEGCYNDFRVCTSFKEFLLWIIENGEIIKKAIEEEYPWYTLTINLIREDKKEHIIMLEGNEDIFRYLSLHQQIDQLIDTQSKNLIDKFQQIKKIINETERTIQE